MKLNRYVDVLIPRGGRGLNQSSGKPEYDPCHRDRNRKLPYLCGRDCRSSDGSGYRDQCKDPACGVCNACESLLVNRKVKDDFLPVLAGRLKEKHVEVRADEAAKALMPGAVPATEEDWGTEYLDYILSVKVVDSVEEAIAHINKYNTKHSEAIITNDYTMPRNSWMR